MSGGIVGLCRSPAAGTTVVTSTGMYMYAWSGFGGTTEAVATFEVPPYEVRC